MLTCQEVIDYLSAYVARELPPDEQTAMERHLAVCPPCVNFLKTFRTTLAVARSSKRLPTEEELPEELVRAVLAARQRSSS
ncbi:MAG: zf-HC2 domain-containing protein [Planctomycetaceae bacterium]|nr:zf-HC2 domain-containing protein [Planctomycetaceae bacterium]